MVRTCIIGAGTAGLRLAQQLTEKGLTNVMLIEPRTGYTRPGYISPIYLPLEDEILYSLPFDKEIHLKDIERRLLKEVIRLKIPIERKEFLRFAPKGEEKGIIVLNAKNEEEFIPCDVVFDCTGSKRAVVEQVNQQAEEPGFTVHTIADNNPVKKHALLYVHMDASNFQILSNEFNKTETFKPNNEKAFEYLMKLEELYKLGWSKMGYPRCFGKEFGKDKVCLYLEVPESLKLDDLELWAHAVFKMMTGQEINFHQLKPSEKYDKKPRMMLFHVNPVIVEQVTYRNEDFPLVILAGDAQIDPLYILGHGLQGVLERIDTMLFYLTLNEGAIDFDEQAYLTQISGKLESHQDSIKSFIAERRKYFAYWLVQAQSFYQSALNETSDPELKDLFAARLDEIASLISLESVESQNSLNSMGFFSHKKKGVNENPLDHGMPPKIE